MRLSLKAIGELAVGNFRTPSPRQRDRKEESSLMNGRNILAVTQSDLQFIRCLRSELENHGFVRLNIARNSQEAILYLRGVGIYSDRDRYPTAEALILDCANSDGSDLDVLCWVREQSEFREIPVFLLCPEMPNGVRPMHDHFSFLVTRQNLRELVYALQNWEALLQLAPVGEPHARL